MRARSGNAIIVVAILALFILAALFSVGFLTATDVSTSSNFLRELRATFLAESIAAQIEARVNARPWAERFWLRQAQAGGSTSPTQGVVPMATLDKASPEVNLSKDKLPASEYEFTAVVKDLPSDLREYRIYVEISIKTETYAFSWDKRHELGLLAGLTRESTVMDKQVDMVDPGEAPVDTLIDTIKKQVDEKPPPETTNRAQTDLLSKLKKDLKSFKASAMTPDPRKAPTISWISRNGWNFDGAGKAAPTKQPLGNRGGR